MEATGATVEGVARRGMSNAHYSSVKHTTHRFRRESKGEQFNCVFSGEQSHHKYGNNGVPTSIGLLEREELATTAVMATASLAGG